MLSKLYIKLKTPTLLSTGHNNQSFNPGKTLANMHQLDQQKKQIQHLQNQKNQISLSIVDQVVDKVIKSVEVTMQNIILLQQEVNQICASNQHQKKKKEIIRCFIQTGGSLTGMEGQQLNEKHDQQKQMQVQVSSSRLSCRDPRYSDCNKTGHNQLKCPSI